MGLVQFCSEISGGLVRSMKKLCALARKLVLRACLLNPRRFRAGRFGSFTDRRDGHWRQTVADAHAEACFAHSQARLRTHKNRGCVRAKRFANVTRGSATTARAVDAALEAPSLCFCGGCAMPRSVGIAVVVRAPQASKAGAMEAASAVRPPRLCVRCKCLGTRPPRSKMHPTQDPSCSRVEDIL